jgi:hypothetical protein
LGVHRQRDFLLLVTLLAAAATPAFGQTVAPAVAAIITNTGDVILGEGLVLYLPPGGRLVYVVNDWTVDVHRYSRKLAFRLGVCNLILVLLSLIIFYGDPDRTATNVAFDLLLAMSWIAVPFLALFGSLVAPVSRLMRIFPYARPVGSDPRHLTQHFELAM